VNATATDTPTQDANLSATDTAVGASAWRTIFRLTAVVVAAFLTFSARHSLTVDGLSYLDIANAYWRRDWSTAINAYWSPLYSWLLGLGLWILKPSSYWEFPAIQFINFAIAIAALFSFEFFWRQQVKFQSQRLGDGQFTALPHWAWQALGYTLFIWTIARATIVSAVTPDLLVAAFIFLAAGIIVRIRAGRDSFGTFALLGLVLGLAYLAKAAMFVLAFIFLGTSLFAAGDRRKAIPKAIAAFVVFVMICAPFVFCISKSKGRFTIGDTAKINYAWGVNQSAPFFNWQAGDLSAGTPRHSTRKLSSSPALYEFATPIGGTYPPHYDPSYWNDGLTPRINVKQQLRALVTSAYSFYSDFFVPQSGLIAATAIALFLSGNLLMIIGRLSEQWPVWFPGFAAIGMYALVTLEHRYVGPFVVLIWAGVLAAIRLPNSRESKRLLTYVTLAGVLTLSLSVIEQIGTRLYEWKDRATPRQWRIANDLSNFGIQPGMRIVTIGSAYHAYWAHLAKLKVIAEVPSGDVESFWAASAETRSELYGICSRIGAKAIVAPELPNGPSQPTWQRIGESGFYVHTLPESETSTTTRP
jgi:4-amino-4-deoxy-L-arabinose transferase-like glycosyltransferase